MKLNKSGLRGKAGSLPRKNRTVPFLVCAVIVLCLLPCTVLLAEKNQFHVDETWTYGLSNSEYRPYLFVWRNGIGEAGSEKRMQTVDQIFDDTEGEFFSQWHSGSDFGEYLTVQENERFDYGSVVYNQSCDVHPPLYYFLIHTISSFFPDIFSVWFTAVPNLVFFAVSLLLLYLITRRLRFGIAASLAVTALWGLSKAGISDTAFLRMYALMTVFTLLAAYFHIRLEDRWNGWALAGIAVTYLLGFLTQYYFYVFAFFLSAVFCFIRLFRKEFARLAVYAGTALASVAVALLLFPYTFDQLSYGAYTSVTFRPSVGSLSKLFDFLRYSICSYFGVELREQALFGIVLIGCLLILCLLHILYVEKTRFGGDDRETFRYLRSVPRRFFRRAARALREKGTSYHLISAAFLLAGAVIGMVAPYMPGFQERYFFNLFPIASVWIVDVLVWILGHIAEKSGRPKIKYAALALTVCVIALCSDFIEKNAYVGVSGAKGDISAEIEDSVCFFVTDKDYLIHGYSVYLQKAEKVFPVHGLEEKLFDEVNSLVGEDDALLLIRSGCTYDRLLRTLSENIGYEVTCVRDHFASCYESEGDALFRVDYTRPVVRAEKGNRD